MYHTSYSFIFLYPLAHAEEEVGQSSILMMYILYAERAERDTAANNAKKRVLPRLSSPTYFACWPYTPPFSSTTRPTVFFLPPRERGAGEAGEGLKEWFHPRKSPRSSSGGRAAGGEGTTAPTPPKIIPPPSKPFYPPQSPYSPLPCVPRPSILHLREKAARVAVPPLLAYTPTAPRSPSDPAPNTNYTVPHSIRGHLFFIFVFSHPVVPPPSRTILLPIEDAAGRRSASGRPILSSYECRIMR